MFSLPFAAVIWSYLALSVVSSCSLASKWTTSNYTLDLTAFQMMGLNIKGTDGEYTYFYSPCNNLHHKNRDEYMVVQKNNQETNYLAQMNSTIDPTVSFDKNDEIVWRFDYNKNISIELICDHTASPLPPYMKITQILEILPQQYLMKVSSLYFCPNNSASHFLAQNECLWNDTSNLLVLDLRSLYGTHIRWEWNGIGNKYSVCQDYEDYTALCVMQYTGGYSHMLWDASVIPSFNGSDNSWTFSYIDTAGHPFDFVWICNPSEDTYNVAFGGTNTVGIESKYACNKGCFFASNDGKNYLDLSYLSGQMITGTDNDLTYSYEYTPCSNYVKCNDSNVMAMRWNIEDRVCDRYLAIFEGNNGDGYNISYDVNNEQWYFRYENGEICEDNKNAHDVFNLYWKCNQNVTNWKVTNVETINECAFSMYIESEAAC